MARSTFKHIFYINRSKQKKNGRCPLMLRITIDGEQVQYSLGEDIAPKDWDSRLGRAKGKSVAHKSSIASYKSIKAKRSVCISPCFGNKATSQPSCLSVSY